MLTAEDFNTRAGLYLSIKRAEKGLSLNALAKAFPEKFSRQYFSKIECGKISFPAYRLHHWALALGFDPGQLYRNVTDARYATSPRSANEDLAITLFVLAKEISDPADIHKLIDMAREFSAKEVVV